MSKNTSFINNHRQLTSFDLRVELLFDAILDKKFDDFNIVLKPSGLFYRRFSKDKMNISRDSINDSILSIEVSRDGFYDILPESITHNNRNREVRENPTQEFKNRKREEKEARHFFNPLENEFFRFKHSIEKYESTFFSELSTIGIADIVRKVLAVDDKISDILVVKMYYALLKLNYSSSQSIDAVCETLEYLLNEKVSYHTENIKLDNVFDIEDNTTDLILGLNTTLESNQQIFLKKFIFEIGPLKNSLNLQNYFLNQNTEIFLKSFFNLFLPFHIQFSFNINLNSDDEIFRMESEIYHSRLGISTRI